MTLPSKMNDDPDPLLHPGLRRAAIAFAVLGAATLGALCLWFPLPQSGAPPHQVPRLLLFLGRFHPVLLHLPVGLLLFGAALWVATLHRLGRSLRVALALCIWMGAASALLAAAAGWMLAQEAGYGGRVFDLHWRLGLATVALALVLLVLHHARTAKIAAIQGVVWFATLTCMGLGAHQGGALTHGETFLSEYAPDWLRPVLGGKREVPAASDATNASDTAFTEEERKKYAAARALFQHYCTECHGATKAKGDQRLHTAEGIAKGGKSGSSVVPGNPDKSLVLTRMLLPYNDKKHMPPEGKPQPASAEIDRLRNWVIAGAPGIPGGGPAASKLALQSNSNSERLDSQKPSATTSTSPEPMKLSTALTHATFLTAAAASQAQSPADSAGFANETLKIFKARCIECHGKGVPDPDEFAFIDDLAQLRQSKYVNLTNPQASKIYQKVQSGDMPRRTQADKDAKKKKADPLSEEQVATILSWLTAGAPPVADSTLVADTKVDGKTKPAQTVALEPTTPAAPEKPAPAPDPKANAPRKLVTPADEITAALADLQTVPREEQPDTRYVSLASTHNNIRLSDTRLLNLRHGARKLLNSLSTGTRVAIFPEVGPEKVLLRVRLHDIGWDAALWDSVAAHFPQAIDTGVSVALGSACHATIPILRADWMASTVARPPLYNDVLRLPKLQQELEKDFGIDVVGNLQAGEAVRSGLVKSGVSLANRMVERHEDRTRAGYFWASYDFRSSGGRANILEFPLGPEKARLAGGQHAFKQAGGEIVFSLPNGFHGYYLADVLGNRLDGAAPTDIVGDRTGVTGRVEVSNGLSCIICHDKGIKPIDLADAIRPLASRFTTEEQRLIERLHPEHDKFEAILKADTERFAAAVRSADAEPVAGQPEAVGALAALFDGEVTIETAAAEIGLGVEDLRKKLDEQNQLFSLRASFKDGGTLLREHFLDYFPDLVERLAIGQVRGGAQPIAVVPLPGRTTPSRPIPVELKTDRTTYKAGEELIVTVQAAESGHLRLLYQNAAGEIYTLFPNQFISDDRIEGGRAVKIVPVPNPKKAGDDVAIQIAGPNFGTEYLAAIVTDQPFTDDEALKAQLRGTQFAKSAARNIEGAITKDARVISRPAREDGTGGARAGFARVTLITVKK